MNSLPLSISLLANLNPLNLDKFPPEIYYFYLFNYLELDIILELRFVSLRFYSIINNYNITELTFTEFFYKSKWLSTKKSTKFRNQKSFRNKFIIASIR